MKADGVVTNLDAVNSELGEVAARLIPGTYLLEVNHSGEQANVKISRL